MLTTSTYDVYLEYASTDDSYFGFSVSSAGDINGDGYDDVVVGADRSDLKAPSAGAAFIFHGGPSMLTTSTYNVYLEYASTDSGYLGRSVSSGDVNGDGYDDVVMGAYLSDFKSTSAGAVFLHMGAKSISSPYFYFAEKITDTPSSIDVTWNGQSSVAASTKNLKLDVYRFGGTNSWESITTDSSCAPNTDCTLSGFISSDVSDYYDSEWSYWRAYQESDNQILQTDYFNITEDFFSTVDISGTVYTDEGINHSMAGPVVTLVRDDTLYATTTASTTDGSYSFSGVSTTPSQIITVYLDTDGGDKAVTISKAVSATTSDFDLYKNRVIVRQESASALTITDMDKYDNEQDADILFTATTSPSISLSVPLLLLLDQKQPPILLVVPGLLLLQLLLRLAVPQLLLQLPLLGKQSLQRAILFTI